MNNEIKTLEMEIKKLEDKKASVRAEGIKNTDMATEALKANYAKDIVGKSALEILNLTKTLTSTIQEVKQTSVENILKEEKEIEVLINQYKEALEMVKQIATEKEANKTYEVSIEEFLSMDLDMTDEFRQMIRENSAESTGWGMQLENANITGLVALENGSVCAAWDGRTYCLNEVVCEDGKARVSDYSVGGNLKGISEKEMKRYNDNLVLGSKIAAFVRL